MQRETGQYISNKDTREPFKAFVPHPLPPTPSIIFSNSLYELMEKANQAIGRLDGFSLQLPNHAHFIYFFIRKEALLSSQIEGTQSSFSELLLYENQEAPGVPMEDILEVSNYIAAMNYGLRRLRSGFPLSLRLVREIHGILLAKGRGSKKTPGEFRRTQNWIGGTRPGNALFVPPPPQYVTECMGALEKFLHNDPISMPVLLKAALAHVQFESIHPFLDGNGRLGRLLITFLLCAEGVLHEPSLYLSLYFKTHRKKYYELLQRVRERGEWELWLDFFLTAVLKTSEEGIHTIQTILKLFERDKCKIEKKDRTSHTIHRIHDFLQEKPIVSVQKMAHALHLTFPTVNKALTLLETLGIVKELTGSKRDRLFAYSAYLEILSKGADPIVSSQPMLNAKGI